MKEKIICFNNIFTLHIVSSADLLAKNNKKINKTNI